MLPPARWEVVWRLYLEVAAGLALTALLVARSLETGCVVIAGGGSVAAILVGIRFNLPPRARVWFLFGGGLLLFSSAERLRYWS